MKMKLSTLSLLWGCVANTALGLSASGWRNQSIYFLMTDRFGLTDNSTTAACNAADGVSKLDFKFIYCAYTDRNNQIYCGGSWQGVINHVREPLRM